jgi:hypothetical protein
LPYLLRQLFLPTSLVAAGDFNAAQALRMSRALCGYALSNIDITTCDEPLYTATNKDHSGRTVADAFHHLPSRRELPDYYEFTKMPIALDAIEGKLKRHEFPNLTTLESYFKRMIQNAKEYNEKGSQVYDDAERIRKALSNFMTKTNPAYKLIPGYVAFPTPLPGQADGAASDEDADGEPDPEIEAASAIKKRGRPPKNPQAQRSSATPALSERSYAGVSFEGLTFQQAQEKIVEDLIRQKESPEFVDTFPSNLNSIDASQRRVCGI